MVDYTKALGSQVGSLMMIRDLGQTVEFWVRSGSAGTWGQNLPYGWTVNGSTGTGKFNYNYPWPGGMYPTPGPWHKLRSFTVLYSQNVTLRIGATGTAGLNGPSEFTKYIERATARVRHDGAWKTAIPYVKSGGVWKPAQAWVRSGGSWKRAG